jgi:hypothetical protein
MHRCRRDEDKVSPSDLKQSPATAGSRDRSAASAATRRRGRFAVRRTQSGHLRGNPLRRRRHLAARRLGRALVGLPALRPSGQFTDPWWHLFGRVSRGVRSESKPPKARSGRSRSAGPVAHCVLARARCTSAAVIAPSVVRRQALAVVRKVGACRSTPAALTILRVSCPWVVGSGKSEMP